jgi:hypothetical protein
LHVIQNAVRWPATEGHLTRRLNQCRHSPGARKDPWRWKIKASIWCFWS